MSLQQGEPRRLEAMIEQRQLDFAITRLPVVNAALHVLPSAVLTRAGFLNPSLDGSLPLLQLFSLTIRRSSAMRAPLQLCRYRRTHNSLGFLLPHLPVSVRDCKLRVRRRRG